MRLAYIDVHLCDYRKDSSEELIEELVSRGIEVKSDIVLTWFEQKYGSIDEFDGLLTHPGIYWQDYYFREYQEEHPNLPFAFVGVDFDEPEIPSFWYNQADEIVEYFSKIISTCEN